MVVTVAAVALAVLVFAAGRAGVEARFFGLMLLFAAAMLLTVTATDLPRCCSWRGRSWARCRTR